MNVKTDRLAGLWRSSVPLFVSAGFWVLNRLAYSRKRIVVYGLDDVRPTILEGSRFLALAALIIFVVRLVDAVVFDLIMRRRRDVVAPQLLRQMVSIAVYLVLFASALKTFFDYDVRTALTTGAVLAAVIGLALQDTLGNLFGGI
ncbi:MAG TPA: mechanosensitive ion channel family protein, partial [Thermoanaerobaculia bacterium]|nr:mechanosensitive ion channel family protein [Thermoanaerobaculia bacterium]